MAGKSSSGNKDTRTRNWNVVVYPDSAPVGWQDMLDEHHIEWVCSPLHDRDINGDGSPKKPHWHVLLMFGGVKSYEQVCEFIQFLNCPIPQRAHNAKASVRYMAHLDNPSKAQYSVSDITAHGGVDLSEMLRPSSSERYSLIRDMLEYVKENKITEFQDLMDYAAYEHFDDWFPLLCDNSAYVVGNYIKSQRHRLHPTVDPSTGEVIQNDSTPKSKKTCKPTSPENVLDDLTGSARGGWSDI